MAQAFKETIIGAHLAWAKSWVPEDLWDRNFGEWPNDLFARFMAGPGNTERAVRNLLDL